MSSGSISVLDAVIKEIDKLRSFLVKKKDKQVRSTEEKELIRANAYAWLKGHRQEVGCDSATLLGIDVDFRKITELSEKSASRFQYQSLLKEIKTKLITLRSELLTQPITAFSTPAHSIKPPDFSPLIRDEKMRAILVRRWEEILKCINADAGLAAMIMMGSLLESLFLAKVLSYSDQSFWFKAKNAPRDKKGNVFSRLDDWKLKDLIAVAHEVGWIGDTAKDISEVMRDYRNFIHPVKEFSSGIRIITKDSKMVLPIFTELSHQIIAYGH